MQLQVQRFVQHGQHSCTSVMAGSAGWSIWVLSRGLDMAADERAKLSTVLEVMESLFAASIAMESCRRKDNKYWLDSRRSLRFMVYTRLLAPDDHADLFV